MSQSRPEQTQNISGKKSRGTSLQTRLVLFVLLLVLTPLIIVSIRDTLQTQQALTYAAEVSLKTSAAQTANSMDTFIQTTLDSVAAEAQFSDFTTYLSLTTETRPLVQARVQDLLNKQRDKNNKYIISYAIVDTKGMVLMDSVGFNVNNDESKEAYFPQVKALNKPVVTAVTYSKDKTPTITFASRIENINGDYVGALRVIYKYTILQDVLTKSVDPAATDASILLLDDLHIRMADSRNPELILKSVAPLAQPDYYTAVTTHRFLDIPREEQATNYSDFELALDNAEKQPFFKADITPKTAGDDTIAVAFLKTQPWIVAYGRPTSIFLTDVQKQIRINIILVLCILILITIITALMSRSLTNPITALAKVANSISQGDLDARADINSTGEIGVLASAFNSMTDQLQSTLVGLEQRVNERTADLQKSTLELETIAIVTREISIIRDVDTLLKVSVELIREQLKYYHVGIFLVDERGEFAILRAASGTAANQMLAQNYKLKVGREGLVGNVSRTGQAHIALDVGTDAIHFQNPFLPETHSEIALPLRSRNMTIGALDIQTNVQSAFNEQNIKVLQLLADQVTAAIENAQLAQQVEVAFAEINNAYRLQTQSAWQSAINQYERPSYEYDGLQVRAVPQNLPNDLLKQLENGKPIIVKENTGLENSHAKTTLLVPLMALNQVIGVIGLEQEDPNHIWTDEEISIAQAAASRAGITLENVRLLEESQRRAVKERTIFDATSRIGSAVNIENILQTTVEELERVLSNSEVVLQFQSDHHQKSEK